MLLAAVGVQTQSLVAQIGGGAALGGALEIAFHDQKGLVDLLQLEEVYEPFLIMEGYLQRTPQGRTATDLGHQRLGLNPDGSQQQSLL